MKYRLIIEIECEDIKKVVDQEDLLKFCLKHPSVTKAKLIEVK